MGPGIAENKGRSREIKATLASTSSLIRSARSLRLTAHDPFKVVYLAEPAFAALDINDGAE